MTHGLKSLLEDLCSGFLCPEKIHRPQPGYNPRTLDLEVRLTRKSTFEFLITSFHSAATASELLSTVDLGAIRHRFDFTDYRLLILFKMQFNTENGILD